MKLTRSSLGEFEELVLLTVCVLVDRAYGVAIKDKIAKHTGRQLSVSAVHAVLHRLEKKGLVVSRMGGETRERGGRRKRLFRITGAGKAALTEMREVRERLWKMIPDFSFKGAGS